MPPSNFTEIRTILLIGGTGFIGTNLGVQLRKAGHRVIVTGRSSTTRDDHPAIILPLDDVAGLMALVRSECVDMVVHLACGLLPSSTVSEYIEEVAQVNLPLLRLARELSVSGVGLTFMSSGGTVYGAGTKARASEDDQCRPISLYGQSKMETELHLQFLARTCGLRLLIVRPSNPYGPHQPLRRAQGLISVVLGRVADNTPLDIWGDGSSMRDYIYVEDATYAIAGLIERNAEGIFNVGSGMGHSLLDVIRSVETVTGRMVSLRFHPARAIDVPRLVLDVTQLATIQLHRARSLMEGVRCYAEQLGMAYAG